MKINIGIIGLGGVGEVLLQAFQKHSMTHVTSLFDVNRERLLNISEKYKIPVVDNYKEMLKKSDVDLVYLAVPPKFHHDIAIDIMRSGKHILCEKPLANSYEESKNMVDELKNFRGKHMMNFPTIYRPSYLRLKEELENGNIGDIHEIILEARFSSWPRTWQQNAWISSKEQGGFIKEVFPHYIQMISRLIGDIKIEYSLITYPEDPTLSETSVFANGKAGGINVVFRAGVEHESEEEINFCFVGSKGTLTLHNWRELFIINGDSKKMVDLPTEDHLQKLIDNMIDHLKGQPSEIVTFLEGLTIQEVLESLISLSESGSSRILL